LRKKQRKNEVNTKKIPNSQSLLERIREENISEIKPVYDPEKGCSNCYPTIEAIVDSEIDVEPLLDEMADSGELIKNLYDKTIICPNCNSQQVSTRYNCPYCNSFDIEKSSLIEHTKCGYMDVEQNFEKNKKLVCPKCNKILEKEDVDYKKAGVWCKCNKCNKNFDIPTPSHFCRKCGSISTFEEVDLKNIYNYKVKDISKSKVKSEDFIFLAIKNFLSKEGWKVYSPLIIKGKSGAEHSFDIAAYRENKKEKPIVFDVAISSEKFVSEQPVIALFAKIFDVSPQKSILISVPQLNINGKKMADLYKIDIIEAKNKKFLIEKLKEIL
jgi:hypothetical protein